jgi:hypothetical protein
MLSIRATAPRRAITPSAGKQASAIAARVTSQSLKVAVDPRSAGAAAVSVSAAAAADDMPAAADGEAAAEAAAADEGAREGCS